MLPAREKGHTMSKLLNPRAIILVWLVVVGGLFALFGPPLTLASASLLLLVGIVPPAMLLILATAPTLTLAEAIAEELHPNDRPRTK